jgi:hypothetical protein
LPATDGADEEEAEAETGHWDIAVRTEAVVNPSTPLPTSNLATLFTLVAQLAELRTATILSNDVASLEAANE